VSSTTTLIFCPPFTAVTAFVVVPGFASTPPQGASFCGSPLSSSTSHEAGSRSLKCALTIGATVAPSTATGNPRIHFFTMSPPRKDVRMAGILAARDRRRRQDFREHLLD